MSAPAGPEDARLRTFAWGPVLLVAAASFLLLLAYAGRYGYHRDELYFLSCGRRLAWGFVDQPPLTPLLARLADTVAPGSLVALRTIPALCTAVTVALSALCAREVGAARVGQTATAIGVAASPGILAGGHLLSTTTLDITLWTLTAFLVLRLLRTRDVRLWLAVGLVLGVALENKWTIGFLVVGLLVGILAGPERRLLWTPWFAAGAAVALAMWAPNLAWQRDHGWPQLSMIAGIQGGESGLGATITWFPFQFAITGFLLAPLWLAGLWRVLRSPQARTWRALGIAYVALAVPLAIVAGDKQYYVAALYLPLAAAGAVWFERWWTRHAGQARRVAIPTALAVVTVAGYPISLPILPASTLATVPLQDINYDLGEQIGWPRFVSEIEAAWTQIPASERSTAIVLTGNYGEAGAIERYGRTLPTPYSGHNSWWWWATPPAGTTAVLAVGIPEPYLRPYFGRLQLVGRLDDGLGVQNDEQGQPIVLATDPTAPLPALWPDLRHYN